MKNCLICERKVSTNGLINHIANHLNYNRHKCTKCSFRSVSVEEMVDHQNQTGHLVEFDSLKNWYLERVCQLIYSDFDYVEKHGIETIRNLGSAFGDRKRLLNLLRSEDVHSEREVQSVSSEEAVETVEDQSTQPTTPQQGGVDLLDHWTRSIEQMITPKNTRNNLTNNTGNSSRTPKITKQLSNNS
ncbi:C2H2-type domain-containing protein [Meloidogyne graminicola]|uniref:C2H2-type domain-containing protein n=1 Tax=Meloidogyne graminicola TaxID=189291 RepID=A0A8S9ZWU6_9BILA|nr:C2H2-type domain-containing protein [Meloidogyne graminicola]